MKRKNKIALSLIIPAIISFSYLNPEKNKNEDIMNVFRRSNNVHEINFENIYIPIESQEYRDMTPARMVKEQLPKSEKITQKNGEKYVIMVNSDVAKYFETKRDDDARFRKNIDSLYKAFIYVGIKKENITVLQGGKDNPEYVSGSATLEELTESVTELKNKISDKDFLIIYFTNHGIDNMGKSYLSLDNEKLLSEDNFMELFSGINYNAALFISAPCKNYNTALRFAGGKNMSLSFSSPEKNVVGGGSQKLAESIFGFDRNGKKLEQDYNRDGKRSIDEIITWAALNNNHTSRLRMIFEPGQTTNSMHRREVHHLIYQNADPNDFFLE